MAQMNTDTAVLASEAANFDRIAGELNSVIAQVQGTAGALQGQWHGQAGVAAQSALDRFNVAASRQQQQLTEISSNIHSSGVQYSTADEDQSSALHTAMQL